MSEASFEKWLEYELEGRRYDILDLYKLKDRMMHVDRIALEQKYMEVVGEHEESIIRVEIECELLEKKKQLVQAALNRREAIDINEIDAEIDKLRQQLLSEAQGSEVSDMPQLTPEMQNELQHYYDLIVSLYHPSVRDLSPAEKELYDDAMEAYRRLDVEALKLVWEMLNSMGDEMVVDDFSSIASFESFHPKDYLLAAEMFEHIVKTEEDIIALDEIEKCETTIEELKKEISGLKDTFPFNAEEMLNDPQKLEEYKQELNQRLYAAEQKQKKHEAEINKMLEVTENG